ncbi:hypothetical protein LXM25_18495 [Dyadobacter sp. LJ53]|uniref:hypothetical protein n=1 Tax=Dyadobacter chenwenxiniae TaxID=2906456 RepID=UPI001F17031A|nr:hypothetical protein [Dyadobacter chenwenxiniae]MCF0052064.1 hypothetical protein [Dyadobacter chenwenxiniae]
MTNFTKKLQNLQARRYDISTGKYSLKESFKRGLYGESTTYALEAMEPIEEEYTRNTFRASERVKAQLENGLREYGIEASFRYQGSVPTDTHIRLHSDIDLLTIHEGFVTLEPPQKPDSPYKGDPLQELANLRAKTYRILDTAYPACDVDDSGGKCISISGGSLNRKIDVISSNWYNSLIHNVSHNEIDRGVNVFDKNEWRRIRNFPFRHIFNINLRDSEVGGNEKRMIRLLKSLKADADENIKISSYDISSLVYRMSNGDLFAGASERLRLLQTTDQFFHKVINDQDFRLSLKVANDTRKIFCEEGASVEELQKLRIELQDLISSIQRELSPIYKNLDQSAVVY